MDRGSTGLWELWWTMGALVCGNQGGLSGIAVPWFMGILVDWIMEPGCIVHSGMKLNREHSLFSFTVHSAPIVHIALWEHCEVVYCSNDGLGFLA